MEPALVVGLLSVLFGGLHVGLAARPIRTPLVARCGERGFTAVFSLTATVTFAALVAYYAAHRVDGAPGLALGAHPWLRWPAIALVVAGVVLQIAGLAAYPRLPSALFRQTVGQARGIERVTRHPFFVGVALFALGHALLAAHLVGTVFAAGLAALAIAGAHHQDAKLLGRRGPAYARYLETTSAVPFAAVASGRQTLVWHELPWGAFALGLVVAVVLRAIHGALFAHEGMGIVLVTVVGAAVASVQSWRRAKRHRVVEAPGVIADVTSARTRGA